MDRTGTQLSYEGLAALREDVRERQLAVFYRNGHFNTMIRHDDGQLYLLCTDLGFATSHVIWERLNEVNGDNPHCDACFQESTAENAEAEALAAAMAMQERHLAAQFGPESGLSPAFGEPDADMLL